MRLFFDSLFSLSPTCVKLNGDEVCGGEDRVSSDQATAPGTLMLFPDLKSLPLLTVYLFAMPKVSLLRKPPIVLDIGIASIFGLVCL